MKEQVSVMRFVGIDIFRQFLAIFVIIQHCWSTSRYSENMYSDYLLLADVLIKQNDFFQAKATLQSLIDNYEGQDILTLAKQKLIEVNDLENQQKDKQKQQIEQRIKQNENK